MGREVSPVVVSVVHAKLKEQPHLALATETPGEYVKASGAQLAELCHSHASFDAEFCETLTPTPVDTKLDEQAIFAAIEFEAPSYSALT